MSSVSIPRWELRSNISRFAPSITTKIDEFMVEEVISADLGILPEFQGHNKGRSIAGGVDGSGSDLVVEDYDVVRHDLLVCQPCDEDVEVIAERKTDSSGVGVVGGNGQVAARLYEYDEEEKKKRPCRCKQRGCKYKAKLMGNLKQHLAHIHDIGVTWHTCPQEGCEYKAKERVKIERHLANIHDIGVTWHTCPQEGCEYKAKQAFRLQEHVSLCHS